MPLLLLYRLMLLLLLRLLPLLPRGFAPALLVPRDSTLTLSPAQVTGGGQDNGGGHAFTLGGGAGLGPRGEISFDQAYPDGASTTWTAALVPLGLGQTHSITL